MKIYVLTEIDLRHVGYSPNTIQLFISRDKALEEMKRMYKQALKARNTTEDDPMNVFDLNGFARIGEADYRLDVYECELATQKSASLLTIQELTIVAEGMGVREMLMDGTIKSMSRDDVWRMMREWAQEFDDAHKGFDYPAHGTSFFDEIDIFVKTKKRQLEIPYKLDTRPMNGDLIINPKDAMGDDKAVYIQAHIFDGYATANGVRMEFPKIADLTINQIKEMDEYLGGRIHDSKCVCVEDVAIWAGKIVSFGVMDTGNGHMLELVREINTRWVEDKDMFEPILKALYERDIDEITDADSFQIPAWKCTPQYIKGQKTGDWSDYNAFVLECMKASWADHARNYLMHVADGQDLETIIKFVRYDRSENA